MTPDIGVSDCPYGIWCPCVREGSDMDALGNSSVVANAVVTEGFRYRLDVVSLKVGHVYSRRLFVSTWPKAYAPLAKGFYDWDMFERYEFLVNICQHCTISSQQLHDGTCFI